MEKNEQTSREQALEAMVSVAKEIEILTKAFDIISEVLQDSEATVLQLPLSKDERHAN